MSCFDLGRSLIVEHRMQSFRVEPMHPLSRRGLDIVATRPGPSAQTSSYLYNEFSDSAMALS